MGSYLGTLLLAGCGVAYLSFSSLGFLFQPVDSQAPSLFSLLTVVAGPPQAPRQKRYIRSE